MDIKLCVICGQAREAYKFNNFYLHCDICRALPARLNSLKQSAKKRNIDFKLTLNSFREWWGTTPDQCFYCRMTINEYLEIRDFVIAYNGKNPEIVKFKRFYEKSFHRKIEKMTIDRVRNRHGYSLENIVKSCWICNSLKGSFFDSEHIRSIAPDIIRKLKGEIFLEKDMLRYHVSH